MLVRRTKIYDTPNLKHNHYIPYRRIRLINETSGFQLVTSSIRDLHTEVEEGKYLN